MLAITPLVAQIPQRNAVYEAYVRKHHKEAIRQMNRHSIPASITMAQGLVETGAGKSSLAMDFNNHFGIKCHNTWQGKRTYKTDDAPNECFRHYDSWQESYEDHSLFLKNKRYLKLYTLPSGDYRAWARGLQLAGYATDKGYANKLIKIIETYELYTLDEGQAPLWLGENNTIQTKHKAQKQEPIREKIVEKPLRPVYSSYGLLYVLADPNDNLERIANEVGIPARKLAKYNDVPLDIRLQEGDIIYLERKNNQATSKYRSHIVVIGDSMYSISQRYGIKLEKLYQMNNKDEDYVPTEGDILRLR